MKTSTSRFWLPRAAYELKPLAYIGIAMLILASYWDWVLAQLGFVLLASWGLMVLFIRRAFRSNGGKLPDSQP